MKLILLALAVCMMAVCMMAAGCVQPQPEPPVIHVDPFNPQFPGQPNCPDGYCPVGPNGETGQEVTSEISLYSSLDVNSIAANEVKKADVIESGPCIPCQPQVTPPSQTRPPATRSPSASATTEAVKHGAFRCEICGKATVGEQWEELWTDDDISLMCVCKECFAKASPEKREAAITSYLKRGDPGLLNRPSVQQAIKTFAAR